MADVLLADQLADWMRRGQEKMKTVVSSSNWNLGSIIQLSTHESMDPLIMPLTARSAWKATERALCSKKWACCICFHFSFCTINAQLECCQKYSQIHARICPLCLRGLLPSDLHSVMLQGFWGSWWKTQWCGEYGTIRTARRIHTSRKHEC